MARFYDNGETDEGRAYVYQGSATGLATSPAWTGESNQASSECVSAAAAGDVNGDGFSDVIVGAHQYDNGQTDEGRAFIYHGSAGGLGLSPAATVESNQSGSSFGRPVATAGDVNGDGFSDVIAGAHLYTNGEIAEGRAFLFAGSAAGIVTSPAWTAESNQAFSSFGFSVANAGDVNADGFSDVVVGALYYDNGQQDEGRAFIYHGSGLGLSGTPAWTAESDHLNANFGISVAAAGDVNGDGFSDVVSGAPRYNNGQVSEGRAYLYLGNDSEGVDRIPRQVRTDDAALISPLGVSDSPTGFLLKTRGRTAEGRGRVRLVVEVKPAGVPFDGTAIMIGPVIDTGAPGGSGSVVELAQLVSGLAPGTLYHWRMRTTSDSPFFPRSPWVSLPYNGFSEADVRTAATGAAVAEPHPFPAPLLLQPNSPNPFARETGFTYSLPEPGRVRLVVYDVAGREVALLVDQVQASGRHAVHWDGRASGGTDLPSGIYLVRFDFSGRTEARKIILAR